MDSQGKTRTFGWIALATVLCMEIYRFSLPYFGASFNDGYRALYLLPFVWLLLESKKKISAI
jgi:hypothetical protein